MSEHRAASALLRGQAEGQGLSPHTTILEGPRVRRPMAGSRHTPTYYSHMYKACTWAHTTHATHTVCTNIHIRRPTTAPRLWCSADTLGHRNHTDKAAYMPVHHCPHIHRCIDTAHTDTCTHTRMGNTHGHPWASTHVQSQTHAWYTVTCLLGTFNL